MKNFFKRIRTALSARQRKEYETAFARVAAAVDSGKLQNSDGATLAIPVIDARKPGWLSHLDGIDWVEIHMLAEENKMPLKTVKDLLSLLQFAIARL